MTRRLALAVVTLLALAATAGAQGRTAPGGGDRRVALVIGNAAYTVGRLNNPSNDARGMAEALRAFGFDVIAVQDAKNLEMRRAVVEFGERLTQGGVGLFYYSGHGMQVGGRNYLLPVDADLKSERYISVESLDVDSVLAQMDAAKSAVNIVILDACRDNPFARQFRSASRGLAFMDAPTGTYIAYATSPGNVAEDGRPGQFGVYTGELLKAMREPGLRIEDVFKKARQGVIAQTKGRQSPWDASSLTGEFYFRGGTVASIQPSPPAAPAVPPAPVIREEIRQELGSLALSARLEGVEVFLREQKIGETRAGRAIVVDNLAVGPHRVRARKPGYKDWEREVQVVSGQRAEIVIDIEPLRTAPVETAAKVIVDDDFRTKQSWATGRSEFCDKRYAPQGYVVATASEKTGCTIFRAYTLPPRARIELTFERLKGPLDYGIGLVFGSTDDIGHALTVDGSPRRSMQLGFRDKRTQKWTALVPWRPDSNVDEGYGVSNTIAVEVRGPELRCFVNGRFVASATSPHPTAGRIGVLLDRAGQEAVFTRLRITELRD